MSLADAVNRFTTAAEDGAPAGYVVTRTAAGGVDPLTGLDAPGTQTTILVNAGIQPYAGDLRVLPEAVHAEDVIVIYTDTPILVTPRPDHVTFRGEDFEVFRVRGPFTSWSGVETWTAYAARQVVP